MSVGVIEDVAVADPDGIGCWMVTLMMTLLLQAVKVVDNVDD